MSLFRLLGDILAGRTPDANLIKTYGWKLISALVLPTTLHDVADFLDRGGYGRKSEQELQDLEREKAKLSFKLRRAHL